MSKFAFRAQVAGNIDRIMDYGKRCWEAKKTGQTDLFSTSPEDPPPLILEEVEPWTRMEALQKEYEALGLFYLWASTR